MKYRMAIAGSTSHTVQCAEALLHDPNFELIWVLTPAPKPIGRKQVITANQLQVFAEQHHIPVILIEQKIDQSIAEQLAQHERPDFLLVVDFGYLVPQWLLEMPRIAPLNIHPSDLPRWRGSSPGQFILLYGEKTSMVSLMVMNEGLDTGPIIYQQPLEVKPTWTQTEYYYQSFDNIGQVLAEKITAYAEGNIQALPQPVDSPTPLARRLLKEDGYVPWSLVSLATQKKNFNEAPTTQFSISPLLTEVYATLHSWPVVLNNASRALNPWPLLWTIILTAKGEKRMQILKSELRTSGELEIIQVKIEGQQELSWAEAQKQLQ